MKRFPGVREQYARSVCVELSNWADAHPASFPDGLRHKLYDLLSWFEDDETQLAAVGHEHDDEDIISAAAALEEGSSAPDPEAARAVLACYHERAALRKELRDSEPDRLDRVLDELREIPGRVDEMPGVTP